MIIAPSHNRWIYDCLTIDFNYIAQVVNGPLIEYSISLHLQLYYDLWHQRNWGGRFQRSDNVPDYYFFDLHRKMSSSIHKTISKKILIVLRSRVR